MTEHYAEARLRAALETRAEHAMTLTDTDRELDRLRGRLTSTGRGRRWRIAAAAAAVAVGGSGVGLAVTWGGGHGKSAITPGHNGARGGHVLPVGTVPAGFPVGSFKHAGTYGLTQLTLSRAGTATLVDPRDDLPTVMAMTFTTPDLVRFDVTHLSASTVQCDGVAGTYTYAVTGGQLTLTAVNDACSQRRIPLSELAWGPISTAIPAGFPTGTFRHPGTYGSTVLHLASDGTASLSAGGGPAGQMATTFRAGSIVEFTLLRRHGAAAAPECARRGVYRWVITGRQITFTVVQDACGIRRIPLSEQPWGPLSTTH
jgi:hypothetical protein